MKENMQKLKVKDCLALSTRHQPSCLLGAEVFVCLLMNLQ